MRILVIFVVFFVSNSWAQNVKTYDLSSIIMQTKKQSITSKIAKSAKENSYFQFIGFSAELKPQLTLTGNLLDYSRDFLGVRQPDGTILFQPRTQNYSSFGFGLSQLISTTGGTISLNSNLTRFDDFERKSLQYSGVPVTLTLVQPLFSFNEFKWLKKIEPLRLQESEKRYDRDVDELTLETVKLFFEVVEAQADLDIAQKNISNQHVIYAIEEKRINLGTTSKDKILQLQLQILESEQELKKATVAIKSSLFSLMNYSGIQDTSNVALVLPEILPEVTISTAEAISKAKENRSEFITYIRKKLEAEKDLEKAKKERIKVNLNVAYGLNGASNRLASLYSQSKSQQSLLLNVVIPILDWGRTRGKIKIAETNLNTAKYTIAQEETALIQEVSNITQSLQLIFDYIGIAKQASKIGNERYELAKEQFTFGKMTVTDLNIALMDKDKARRSYITALKEFWTSYYQLIALTHSDISK